MSLSVYEIAVPVFTQQMTALTTVLDLAEADCAERKIDEGAVLGMRLYPDMFTMAQQVRQATGHVKGALARLAGAEVPKPSADGTSFAELKEQVASALEAAGACAPDKLEGSEDKEVELVRPGVTQTFSGRDYLLHNAIPQVCFHVATCHGILRHAGVELGKRHYLTPAPK